MLFNKEPKETPDAVTDARAAVDRLAAALAKAEKESSDARIAYDQAMREHVGRGDGKNPPSQEPQQAANAKIESLRRLLHDARELFSRATKEADDARRLAAIQASDSEVARLTGAAEAKLAEFEAAAKAVRRIEGELFEVLFGEVAGLKQELPDPAAQSDAQWCRGRLARRAIDVAVRNRCMIEAGFEIDGEFHQGLLETHFYRRPPGSR